MVCALPQLTRTPRSPRRAARHPRAHAPGARACLAATALVALALGGIAPAQAAGVGDVVANASPIGRVDSISTTINAITVVGWALDPDTSEPITVHVYVDGAPRAITADASRPDVAAAFGDGDRHGFATTIAAATGQHAVCVYAINTPAGDNPALKCATVTVANAEPIGRVDSISTTISSISVAGWALDPDTSDPITVHVYVDGAPRAIAADASRPDVAAAFGHGDRHGFATTVPVGVGNHAVCVYAINTPAGDNPTLECTTVAVVNSTPFGRIDSLSATWNHVTLTGWALDPDTSDPITVHVYVDRTPFAFTADTSRPDVGAAFGHGDRHGFTATADFGPGDHTVCVYGINTPAGDNAVIGCQHIGSVIVGYAATFLGVPYLWGGSTPAAFDCSGLTSYVYAHFGVHLPRTSTDQHNAGAVVDRSQALPGDLIWSPGHIAIYAGGNQLIDATPGNVVRFHAIYQSAPVFIRIG